MIEDALGGEKLIAMALLREGYEPYYNTSRAPIHPVVGVGRIIACTKLDDGRFNMLLRGETRAKLMEELPGRAYRFARVEALPSQLPSTPDVERRLRLEIRRTLEQAAVDSALKQQMITLCENVADLGDLCDLLASVTPMHIELQQLLLSEPAVSARVAFLVRTMREQAKAFHASLTPRHDQWHLN